MDEVELLLLVVVVSAALDAGGHDDRVHAERAHVEPAADLPKAGAVAEVLEVSDGVAVAARDAGVLTGSRHCALLSPVRAL